MEWWTLFRRIRIVAFAFISIASLALAVALSFYLSKEWIHSSTLQRAIVLALIGVNALTSLLLYLMAVVVFRMWKELLRMLFLLAIHIGTAVPFTLFGFSLPCAAIFGSASTCRVISLVILSSAWSITGLLFGYTVYLCIMSRVPRPFPLVIHNDLLATPPVSRAPSMASMHSSSRLLHQSNTPPSARPVSPSSVYSQNSIQARTVPKRLFVANATPPPSALPTSPQDGPLQRARSYGATTSQAREVEPSVMQSRFSTSTIGSIETVVPSPPRRLFSLRHARSEGHLRRPSASSTTSPKPKRPSQDMAQRVPPRPLLLNPNPFSEPLSRHGTPETALSGYSFASAPGNMSVRRYAFPAPPQSGMQSALAQGMYLTPSPPPPTQIYASAPVPLDRAGSPQSQVYVVSPGPAGYAYLAPYAVQYTGPPVRAHAATPSADSIHSMSPSIHFHPDAPPLLALGPPRRGSASSASSGHPAALTPAHPANADGDASPTASARAEMGTGMRLPPAVHLRSASDPVFRPYSADPRVRGGEYEGILLPNPYVAGAEIRRYGSVPHVRSDGYGYGLGGGAGGRAGAVAAAEDPRWREAVMKAAAGRR
ncbi:hypothetical protein C8Q77DRAFT_526582 [Trametes polyzona]|nr:hypothetical protein C8Q77DRAFT_526582 [Trametes polyzona]